MHMDGNNFLSFHSFSDPESANAVADLLKENHIPYQLIKLPSLLDSSIIGTSSMPDYELKLKQQDFIRGQECLDNYFKTRTDEVDEDYYLFSFTDSELMDIIHKKDEWGYFDFQLAKKILNDRGVEINESDIEQFRQERKKELASPERPGSFLYIVAILSILCGVLFAISPVFGLPAIPFIWCFVGVCAGLLITSSKKTLPDGQRVYAYSEKDRKYGKLIWQIGLAVFICVILKFVLESWSLYNS